MTEAAKKFLQKHYEFTDKVIAVEKALDIDEGKLNSEDAVGWVNAYSLPSPGSYSHDKGDDYQIFDTFTGEVELTGDPKIESVKYYIKDGEPFIKFNIVCEGEATLYGDEVVGGDGYWQPYEYASEEAKFSIYYEVYFLLDEILNPDGNFEYIEPKLVDVVKE